MITKVLCGFCDLQFAFYATQCSEQKLISHYDYTIYYLWLLDFLIAHAVCWGLGGCIFGQVARSLPLTVKIPMERRAAFFPFVWWWMKVKWISLRRTFRILLRIKLQLHHNNRCAWFFFSAWRLSAAIRKSDFMTRSKCFCGLLLNEIHLLHRIEFYAIYKKYRAEILRRGRCRRHRWYHPQHGREHNGINEARWLYWNC